MKIGIDCRMYGLQHAGIGRYVENLVKGLVKSREEGLEFVLFVRKKGKEQLAIKPFSHLTIVESDFPHYSLREQVFMPFVLRRAKCDLVHFPHFNVPFFYFGHYLVTVHDLIKHESKGMTTTTKNPIFYWLKYLGYLLVIGSAVKRAKKVVVPSEWVKKKVIKQFRLEPKKVRVIYEGVSKKIKSQKLKVKSQIMEALGKYGIKKPYLLYVGSVYPHKNIERLMEATGQILSEKKKSPSILVSQYPSISLVIVCSRSVFWERLKRKVVRMKAQNFVNLVGFVPDEDLPFLYQNAEAFVFPSFSEGFGLPGLEAMVSGCPVVCSEIPVFKEVYGEAAVYFDPFDVDDMEEKVKLIIENGKLKKEMREKGLNKVKDYSWEKCARKTLKVYKEVLGIR